MKNKECKCDPCTCDDEVTVANLRPAPRIEEMSSLALKTKKLVKRTKPVQLFVVHTTGAGLYGRWKGDNEFGVAQPGYDPAPYSRKEWRARRGMEATPFDTALRVYCSIYKHSPTFVVCGDTGRIAQISPIDRRTTHTGVGSRVEGTHVSRYGWKWFGWKKKCGWWVDRWRGVYDSPRDMAGGTLWQENLANDIGIGVEVAPPAAGPYAPWSEECIRSLEFLAQMCRREFGSLTALTHSDLHPINRTSRGRPTDPGYSQWDDAVRKRVEAAAKG